MRSLYLFCALVLFLAPGVQKSGTPQKKNTQPEAARLFEHDTLFLRYYTALVNTPAVQGITARFPGDATGEIKKRFLNAVHLRKKREYKQAYSQLMPDALTGINSLLFYYELARTATAARTTDDCLMLLRASGAAQPFLPFTQAVILSLNGFHSKAADTLAKGYTSAYSRSPFYFLFTAELFRRAGNYTAAQEYADSAVAKNKLFYAGEVPSLLQCRVYGVLGNIAWYKGNKKEAARLYQLRLTLAKKYDLQAEKAFALTSTGITLDDENNTGKARLAFDEALSTARMLNEDELLAYVLMESGVGYTLSGDYPSAVRQYKEAFDIYKATGNRARLALLADNMGRHYFSLGLLREARESFTEGLEYDEDNPRGAATHSQGLADVYAACGNYTEALTLYTKARAYADKINDAGLTAEIDYGIGAMCYYAGNVNAARRKWQEVISGYPRHGNAFITGLSVQGCAVLLLEQDSTDSAEKMYSLAADYFKASGDAGPAAFGKADLARAYIAAGNTEKGTQLLSGISHSGNPLYSHKLEPMLLLARAELALKTGNAQVAFRTGNDALLLARKHKDHTLACEVLELLARCSAAAGNIAVAKKYFSDALDEKENIEQILFPEQSLQVVYNEKNHTLYEHYAEFLREQGLNEEAFIVTERERSRSTFQKLMTVRLNDKGQMNRLLERTLEARWLAGSALVNQKDKDSLERFIQANEQQLLSSYPELAALLIPGSITLQQLAATVPSGTVYLQIVTGKKSVTLYALTGGKLTSVTLPWNAQDIEERLSAISPYYYPGKENAPLTADLFAFNAGAAHQLYKEMFEPLLSRINGADRLLLSVPGKLSGFPFELLVTGGTLSSDYRYDDKQFLLDTYTISYIPALKLFSELQRRGDVFQGEYLAIGNPVISGTGSGFALHRGLLDELPGAQRGVALLPLKYSEEELDEISSLLPSVRIFSKENATEDNFRKYAGSAKLIHISTHSALLQNLPVIFFASTGKENSDGALIPAEVAGMHLNADLVTLSSCQSGSGLSTVAEGITGMSKAFFEGGAKSVVVSLWEVNDRYTATFMKFFYESLSNGNDKAIALREAKTRFRKEVNANPYYWGAFILSGKTTPLLQVSGIERYRLLLAVCFLLLFGSVTAAWYFTAKRRRA